MTLHFSDADEPIGAAVTLDAAIGIVNGRLTFIGWSVIGGLALRALLGALVNFSFNDQPPANTPNNKPKNVM